MPHCRCRDRAFDHVVVRKGRKGKRNAGEHRLPAGLEHAAIECSGVARERARPRCATPKQFLPVYSNPSEPACSSGMTISRLRMLS